MRITLIIIFFMVKNFFVMPGTRDLATVDFYINSIYQIKNFYTSLELLSNQ